ncbi:hypothetical protein [Chloroflexus sp.]|uniref:hypothetical protein n=1 Tax=Chloroflexus sp. TaxID=1904827 RepID=UPI00260B9639|nr:hypothetical protein [uncultured Chloroflexus sp.]
MASDEQQESAWQRRARLRLMLQRIVLLRETGPKSAVWHRARVKAMWRLQEQLAADADLPEQSTKIRDEQ